MEEFMGTKNKCRGASRKGESPLPCGRCSKRDGVKRQESDDQKKGRGPLRDFVPPRLSEQGVILGASR